MDRHTDCSVYTADQALLSCSGDRTRCVCEHSNVQTALIPQREGGANQVQANLASLEVDVGVEDLGDEVDLGRAQGVVLRHHDVQLKPAACGAAKGLSLPCCGASCIKKERWQEGMQCLRRGCLVGRRCMLASAEDRPHPWGRERCPLRLPSAALCTLSTTDSLPAGIITASLDHGCHQSSEAGTHHLVLLFMLFLFNLFLFSV